MTPRARIAIVAVAVVALVAAFVAASGSGGGGNVATTPTAAPQATAPSDTTPTASGATGTTTAGTGTAPAATTPAAPPAPVVRVVGGKPQGGVRTLTFKKGGQVRFTVASDVADEVHVHGYDIHKNVAKGGSVTFSFPAKIDGRFVVELEARHEEIAHLEVQP